MIEAKGPLGWVEACACYSSCEWEATRTVGCRANSDLVLPCRRECEALPFNLEIETLLDPPCQDRVRSAESMGGRREIPSRDR